jgi:hypothetical protein
MIGDFGDSFGHPEIAAPGWLTRKLRLCGDLLLTGRRGMSVVMKNRKNNVSPFPKPPEEPGGSTIICQIGSERFALHMQVEDLPPAQPPVVMLKRRAKKVLSNVVKMAAGK